MSMLLAKLKGNRKLNRAATLALHPPKEYSDGRTKQSFRDETDINAIMKRAQVTGTISHLNKYEARYGDFANFDFLGHQLMLGQAQDIFDDLQPEMRSEFHNSPQEFFDYVNDPANIDKLAERLPDLARPGRQNLVTLGNIGADAEAAAVSREQPITEVTATAPAETAPATSGAVITPPADPPAA